jgi:hypothetical protein
MGHPWLDLDLAQKGHPPKPLPSHRKAFYTIHQGAAASSIYKAGTPLKIDIFRP